MKQPAPNHLLSAKADAIADQVVANAQAADVIAREALSAPLPGPLSDAWAPIADTTIQVGPFVVRRPTDGDLETLWQLDNTFAKAIVGAIDGGNLDILKKTPRGPQIWQLLWVLTRPAKEVRDKKNSEGIKSIALAAEEVFSEMNVQQIVALTGAAFDQVPYYFSTVISYGTDAKGANANPTSAVQP